MATQKDFIVKNGLQVKNGNIVTSDGSLNLVDQISGDTGQITIANGQLGDSFMRIGIIGGGTANSHIRTDSTLEFHIGQSATSSTPSVSINSDNLLVGTTDSSLYNNTTGVGVALHDNHIQVARSSGVPLYLNRQTSDGTIAEFRKNGSKIGNIGTYNSDLHIGTGDTGIGFNNASRSIVPMNTSTPDFAISLISLGTSSVKFKDLHLSGNITLNGTITNGAFTIPNSIGSAGQVLKVPSSGTTLEWGDSTSGSITGITNFADNRLLTASGSTTINGEADLTWNDVQLAFDSGAGSSGSLGAGGVVGSLSSDVILTSTNRLVLGQGGYGRIYISGSDVNVSGNLQIGGVQVINSARNISNIGTYSGSGTLTITKNQVTSNFATTPAIRVHPASVSSSGGRSALFLGTSTIDNYGISLRGARLGTNGNPTFEVAVHQNSGNGLVALSIDTNRNASFSHNVQMGSGNATGKFAVKSSAVHGSFDFYNNGTSYFNGATTIDDALDLTGSNRKLNIAGTTVIDASRNLTNIGTISSGAITSSGLTVSTASSVPTFDIITTHPSGIPIVNLKGAASAQVRYQDENGNNQSRIDFNDAGAFNFIDATDGSSHLLINSSGNSTFSGKVTINEGNVADQLVIYRTSPSSNQVGMKFDVHGVHSRFFGVGTDGHPYWSTTADLTGAGNGVWHSGLTNFKVGTVSVLTSSRNLQNIGTISSGTITSSGNVNSSTINSTGQITTGYGLSLTNGNTNFLLYNNTNDNLLYMRDTTNGQMLTTWYPTIFTVNKELSVTGNIKKGGTVIMDGSRNLTNIGTISSGAISSSSNITAGNSSNNGYVQANLASSGGTMTLYGYGLEMNRGASYIRPSSDGDKTLYVGGADDSLDWESVRFRTTNGGLYQNGSKFMDGSRNLTNIGTISSGAITAKSSGSTSDQISLVHSGNTVKIASLGQESSHGSLILRNNGGANRVRLSAGGNDSYLLNSNFGIGITSPSALFHLQSEDSTTNDAVNMMILTALSTGTTTTGFGPAILLQGERNNGVMQNVGRIRSIAEVNSGTNISSGLAFETSVAGVLNESLRISYDGNVSIAGTITVNGTGASDFRGIDLVGSNPAVYFKDSNANTAWHIGHNGGNLWVLEDSNRSGGYNSIRASWDAVGYDQYSGNINIRAGALTMGAADTTVIDSSRNLTNIGTISSGVLSVNSGSANIAATFQSTDGIAGIKLQDSVGNVELSASGATFRVQPSGGTPVLEVNSSGNANFTGQITSNGTASTLRNSSGVTLKLTTNGSAGSVSSKLPLHIDFNGYGQTTMARIRSWDESSSTADGFLEFYTNNFTGSHALRRVLLLDNDRNATFDGNVTVTGTLAGKSDNTTEIGTYSTGAIKRIRMAQGGELHFGDTTTSSPLGITEGEWNNFGDQDRMSIYYRSSLKLFSGTSEKFAFDTSGNLNVTGSTSTGDLKIGSTTVINGARQLTNIASANVAGNITVDYTGNGTNDAGIFIQNDASDWGLRIHKVSTHTYGMQIDADGSYVFRTVNSSGVEKFRIDGDGDIETVRNITSTGDINSSNVQINSNGIYLLNGNYRVGSTAIVDSNRNLVNIGTISSGAITAAGDIELTTGDLKYTGGINWDIAHHGASQNIVFKTTPSGGSATEVMRIRHDGKIGIYDSVPQDYLEINGSGKGLGGLTISNSTHNHSALSFARSSTATARIYLNEPDATHTGQLNFQTSNASGGSPNLVTALTLDGSQNATFTGTISAAYNGGSQPTFTVDATGDVECNTFTALGTAQIDGQLSSGESFSFTGGGQIRDAKTSSTDPILTVKNNSSTNTDGTLVDFLASNDNLRGSIGTRQSENNTNLYIIGSSGTYQTGLKFLSFQSYRAIYPAGAEGATTDNTIDLGYSSGRFQDIYATNGTIQTSDKNEKQDIQALTEAEQRVATACKGLIRRFRWQDAVQDKDNNPDSDETARYHFGVMAQDLQSAFTAEGLDAGDYGMFISSTWTDDKGNEQTRLGVRYNELLAFIISTL